MRAIHELVAYLTDRGALTPGQLAELERHGFNPPRPESADDTPVYTEVPPDEDFPPPRARPTRRPAPAPTGPTGQELADRLAAVAGSWSGPLAGLDRLGRRLVPSANWQAAVLGLRKATVPAIVAGLSAELRADRQTWKAVWDALAFDPDAGVLADGDRGKAASAYRALRAVADPSRAGKYAWLLKFDPIRDVHNLRLARRAVLAAVGELAVADPGLVAGCHRTAFHPLGYAAGVLAYTARVRRAAPAAGAFPVRLAGDPPPEAWACASGVTPATAWLLARWDSLSDIHRVSSAGFTCTLSEVEATALDHRLAECWRTLSGPERSVLVGRHRFDVAPSLIARWLQPAGFTADDVGELLVRGESELTEAAARWAGWLTRIGPHDLAVAWLRAWAIDADRAVYGWTDTDERHPLRDLPARPWSPADRAAAWAAQGVLSPHFAPAEPDGRRKLLCPPDWHS